VVRRILGIVLLVVFGIAVIIYAVALIDPVGSQMANDGDPFGTPPPWQYAALGLIVSLVVAGFGGWLTFFGQSSTRHRSGGDRE